MAKTPYRHCRRSHEARLQAVPSGRNELLCNQSSGIACGDSRLFGVMYSYLEKDQSRPRGVLGMFDVSSRPFVPDDKLTFSAPTNKFMSMVNPMEEGLLITHSWEKIKKRIKS